LFLSIGEGKGRDGFSTLSSGMTRVKKKNKKKLSSFPNQISRRGGKKRFPSFPSFQFPAVDEGEEEGRKKIQAALPDLSLTRPCERGKGKGEKKTIS